MPVKWNSVFAPKISDPLVVQRVEEEEEESPDVVDEMGTLRKLWHSVGRSAVGVTQQSMGIASELARIPSKQAKILEKLAEPISPRAAAGIRSRREALTTPSKVLEAGIQAGGEFAQRKFPVSPATAKAEAEGKEWTTPSWYLERGSEALLSMVPMVAASVASGGATAPGLLVAGGQSFGATRNESYQRLREKGLSDEDAAALAAIQGTGVGAVTMVTNIPVLDKILKLPPKTKAGILNAITGRLKGMGVAAVMEAPQEMLEGAAADAFQRVVESDPTAFEGFVRRRMIEGTLGAIAGGAMKGGVDLVRSSEQARIERRTTARAASTAAETRAKLVKEKQEQRSSAAAHRAIEILQESDGVARLQKLGRLENPTRQDFESAGFNMGELQLNAIQRKEIAGLYSPDRFADLGRVVLDALGERSDAAPTQPVAPPAMAKEAIQSLVVDAIKTGRTTAATESYQKAMAALQEGGATLTEAEAILKQHWARQDHEAMKARVKPGRLGHRAITADQLANPKITKARESALERLRTRWSKAASRSAPSPSPAAIPLVSFRCSAS